MIFDQRSLEIGKCFSLLVTLFFYHPEGLFYDVMVDGVKLLYAYDV
jgi:hypothetical protein